MTAFQLFFYEFCEIFRNCYSVGPEAYSEPCQTSKMDRFAKIVVNYCCKTLHLRSFAVFQYAYDSIEHCWNGPLLL